MWMKIFITKVRKSGKLEASTQMLFKACYCMIPVFDWWRVVIRAGCVSIGGAKIDFTLSRGRAGGTFSERGKQWQMGGKNQDRLPWTRGAPNQICHCSQWPIKIMDDARARQMEIMEIIFSKTITWWFTFLSTRVFLSKTSSFVRKFPALMVCRDCSRMINPPRPALTPHIVICTGYCRTKIASFASDPPIYKMSPNINFLCSSLRKSPLSPPWQLLLQEASIITPRQFPQ